MMKYAKVVEMAANRVKVKSNGDDVASEILYYYLSSYVPALDDVVVIDDKLHVVLGKVNK